MLSIVERYLGSMLPLTKQKGPTNKPLYKGSMGNVSGEYKRKRWLEKQKVKGVENLKKKLLSQSQNPMQNI